MSTTDIQKQSSIRKGSVRVEIGDSFGALVDIGALRDPQLTLLGENQAIEFDNVDDLKKFVNGKKVQMNFNLAEINLTNLATLDAGLVTLSTVAGTLVSGATQTFVQGEWVLDQVYELEGQNADGSAPSITSVVGTGDGAFPVNTGYRIVKLANGNWGISITDSGTVTDANQSFTVTYSYTPATAKKLTFNDSGVKVLKVMRISNIDENGKAFRIDIEKATNFAPVSIDFAGDDEEDVAVMPVQFEGDIVEIVDEQQTT